MKILIASDSHDRWDHLAKAVLLGNEKHCEHMLFAGDFMSPPGLACFDTFKGHVHFVWGNNDGEKMMLTRQIDERENMTLHGAVMEETLGDLRFYMNHYPDFARNAGLTGRYDICVYGHDHMYNEEKLENGTLLLNPGEIQGYRTGTSTCMVFDTDTKAVEKIEI